MNGSKPLPPSFTSLYRLFLRSISSSVLNDSRATRRLRALWRPMFSQAAETIHRLENCSQSSREAHQLTHWLNQWQVRVDNTLSILCNASDNRGLPHHLTKNLAILYHSHSIQMKARPKGSSTWNGQLSIPEYERRLKDITSRPKKEVRRRELSEVAWAGLGEVITMAEGRDEILLGRLERRRR